MHGIMNFKVMIFFVFSRSMVHISACTDHSGCCYSWFASDHAAGKYSDLASIYVSTASLQALASSPLPIHLITRHGSLWAIKGVITENINKPEP
jgi:hypothetical protein